MKAKRIFQGPDITMMSAVKSLINLFAHHLADFTAFDPSLDAAYLANWKAVGEEVWSNPDDTYVVDRDKLAKEEVFSALEKCLIKNKEVKYYAGKAFPANKEALKEFGEGQFAKVRKSPLRMVQYMETLYGVATKYKAELIAKQYTQSAIDEIAALAQELRQENNAQQLKKKERPTQTRKRIELMNTYYRMGQPVVNVAQYIYMKNPANRKFFRLTVPVPSTAEKRTWLVLATEGIRKIALPKLLKKFEVSLTNQSTGISEYWYVDTVKEAPAKINVLAAGEQLILTLPQPVKKFLVVQNISVEKMRLRLVKKPKQ